MQRSFELLTVDRKGHACQRTSTGSFGASTEVGSDRTSRLEAFGAAVADAVGELAEAGEAGLLTAHDASTDFLLGWAEVSPSQVLADGRQPIVPHPQDPDRDLEKLGAVLVRRWALSERWTLPAQPDAGAADIVASETVEALREQGSGEEAFVLVHGSHDDTIRGLGWYEP